MTPEQIAAMIADRESGTPGSWKVKFRKDGSAYMSIGGDRPGDAHSKFSIGLDSQYPSDVTNARRIARVPDMEATIIAQAAELATLRAERDALKSGLLSSAGVEYILDHPMETDVERMGRHSAVRGMMVRLGLYPQLEQAIDDAIALKGGA